MKKILTLLLVLCILTFVACDAEADVDDPNNDNTELNNNNNETIGDPNNNDPGNTNNNDFTTDLRDIDNNLTTRLDELDAMDTDDIDFATRGTLYTDRATAYETALNDFDNINFGDTNPDYYDDVRGYYEEGYNRYNDLATNYADFQTEEDERTFLDDFGEDTGLSQDVETRYRDALRNIDID